MTDDELKALVASLAVSQDRTDEQMKHTDKKLERLGITLGNVTNNQGDVAEEFFSKPDKRQSPRQYPF